MKTTTIILLASALTGCAGSPLHIATMNAEQLAAQSDATLCAAYGHSQNQGALKELKTRKTITRWDIIMRKGIQTGMTSVELLCSRGIPTRVKTSVGSYGTHKQWIYGIHRNIFAPVYYVYTKNGVVTGWQK